MLTVEIALLPLEPPGSGVVEPGAVQPFRLPVHGIAVELAPALIKDGVCDDAGMVIQMSDGVRHVPSEKRFPPPAPQPAGAFQIHSDGGQRCVPNPGIPPAVHHVLHHQHAVEVAVIVETFRLNLDVLAQQVQPQIFHAQDVPLILCLFRREIDSVTEVSLVKDAVEEQGLPV